MHESALRSSQASVQRMVSQAARHSARGGPAGQPQVAQSDPSGRHVVDDCLSTSTHRASPCAFSSHVLQVQSSGGQALVARTTGERVVGVIAGEGEDEHQKRHRRACTTSDGVRRAHAPPQSRAGGIAPP
jgi:hypothetical protein